MLNAKQSLLFFNFVLIYVCFSFF